jgi:hypothetical protein
VPGSPRIKAPTALFTLILTALCLSAAHAASPDLPRKAAIFNFELIDTSEEGAMNGRRADETRRLGELDSFLKSRLIGSGKFTAVDLAPVQTDLSQAGDLYKCNGCAADIAKKAGAEVAIIGWVQKVSNLILNINLEIDDAATGKALQRGSVDIRGNTDESWHRGLDYLLRNRILKAENGPK